MSPGPLHRIEAMGTEWQLLQGALLSRGVLATIENAGRPGAAGTSVSGRPSASAAGPGVEAGADTA
jgi:hypothetical protein